jgi:hypothetical protein
MSDFTLCGPAVKTVHEPVTLTSNPQVVSTRDAIRCIREADYVGVYVTTGQHGAADIIDISKRRIVRLLRQREKVWASVLFGCVVIGRPEPI